MTEETWKQAGKLKSRGMKGEGLWEAGGLVSDYWPNEQNSVSGCRVAVAMTSKKKIRNI